MPTETYFDIKKSYNEYPSSSISDGTVYVKQGQVQNATGPEYSVRLGSGSGLQLDKDKIYTVENQSYSTGQSAGGIGTYTGSVPGLVGYFDGLKIIYNLDIIDGADDKVTININSIGSKTIYDSKGNEITAELIKIGIVVLQYSESIQIAGSQDQASGFQIVSETNDMYLRKTGGSVSGQINMSGNKITNLGNPITDNDAANKGYVDTIIEDLCSVQCPDVLADNIDGRMKTSYAYMTVTYRTDGSDTQAITSHDILGFGVNKYMDPNTHIHVFVYCSGAKDAEPGPYTYDENNRVFSVPTDFCGGHAHTERDYTWINGNKTSTVTNSYVRFVIPASGMIEFDIYYNVYQSNSNEYSRTVVLTSARTEQE